MRYKRIILDGCETDYIIYDNGSICNEKTNEIIEPMMLDSRRCTDPGYEKSHYRHLYTVLYFKKKRHVIQTDVLIARHYIPNPNGYKQIAHLDGDPSNMNPNNLVWMPIRRITMKNRRALTPEIIHEACRQIVAGKMISEIAKNLNIDIHFVKYLKYCNSFPEIASQYGIKYERESDKYTVWNDEIRAKVIKLIEEENITKSDEIAKILEVPATTKFKNKIKRLKYKLKYKGKYKRCNEIRSEEDYMDPQRLARYERNLK